MKRARRFLVCALTLLLLFGGIGVSAALAAGDAGEAAQAEGSLIVVENKEITVFEENVPLASGPAEGSCCVLHLLLLSLALLAELVWVHDDRKLQGEEFALRARLTTSEHHREAILPRKHGKIGGR